MVDTAERAFSGVIVKVDHRPGRVGGGKTGDGPLGDEFRLQLRESGEDPEDGYFCCGVGVYRGTLAGKNFQSDAAGGGVVDGV
jgi:hypothetical protein